MGHAGAREALAGGAARGLVEVEAHHEGRVFAQPAAALGAVANQLPDVLEPGAVARAHVGEAARLFVDRQVEGVEHDLVGGREVAAVAGAAGLDVDAAVDVAFGLTGDLAQDAAVVAEEQGIYNADSKPGAIAEIPPDEMARLIKDLERQMKDASKQLEFERAALLRDQIIELRRIQEVM